MKKIAVLLLLSLAGCVQQKIMNPSDLGTVMRESNYLCEEKRRISGDLSQESYFKCLQKQADIEVNKYSSKYVIVFNEMFARIFPKAKLYDTGDITEKEFIADREKIAAIAVDKIYQVNLEIQDAQARGRAMALALAQGMQGQSNLYQQQAVMAQQRALAAQQNMVTQPPQQYNPPQTVHCQVQGVSTYTAGGGVTCY